VRAGAERQGAVADLLEFNILRLSGRRSPGVVFTRYQIVDSLHGGNYIVSDRAVDVQIAYLRKKLGDCKDYIETVRGVGYRFRDNLSQASCRSDAGNAGPAQ
jgi:two-component system phosphate regulon response regulator PhoB